MTRPALQIVQSVQRLVCTGCGAEANAACNCGLPYNIAEIVSRSDSYRQREHERREKARKKKQKQRSCPGDIPTEAEADESYQETLFDQACLLLDSMAGSTRQRFFAYLKEKYDVVED